MRWGEGGADLLSGLAMIYLCGRLKGSAKAANPRRRHASGGLVSMVDEVWCWWRRKNLHHWLGVYENESLSNSLKAWPPLCCPGENFAGVYGACSGVGDFGFAGFASTELWICRMQRCLVVRHVLRACVVLCEHGEQYAGQSGAVLSWDYFTICGRMRESGCNN